MLWAVYLVPTGLAWLAWWFLGHWHWSLDYGLFGAAVLLSAYTLFSKALEEGMRP